MILELDGGTHDAPFRDPEQDRLRDDWLRKQGFTVLRFRNEVATSRPNTILEAIRAAADLPSPLAGEGVGGADG